MFLFSEVRWFRGWVGFGLGGFGFGLILVRVGFGLGEFRLDNLVVCKCFSTLNKKISEKNNK